MNLIFRDFSLATKKKQGWQKAGILFPRGGRGRRENSEAPGQKRKMRPLRVKRAENFYCLELYYGLLLLVHLMRPFTP